MGGSIFTLPIQSGLGIRSIFSSDLTVEDLISAAVDIKDFFMLEIREARSHTSFPNWLFFSSRTLPILALLELSPPFHSAIPPSRSTIATARLCAGSDGDRIGLPPFAGMKFGRSQSCE